MQNDAFEYVDMYIPRKWYFIDKNWWSILLHIYF